MQVRVYRNSKLDQWAVVNVATRRVAFYADALTLVDVTWHSGLKGQHRICKSGHKNRHNYAEGRLRSFQSAPSQARTGLPMGEHPVAYSIHHPQFMQRTGMLGAAYDKRLERSAIANFTDYGFAYVECNCAGMSRL